MNNDEPRSDLITTVLGLGGSIRFSAVVGNRARTSHGFEPLGARPKIRLALGGVVSVGGKNRTFEMPGGTSVVRRDTTRRVAVDMGWVRRKWRGRPAHDR
jgi:hypothetical protein